MPERAQTGVDGERPAPRAERKQRAIIQAAEEVFLRAGYLGTNMDEVATLSGVSKQTIYKHFGSKEALFVELVSSMTDTASDLVLDEVRTLPADGQLGTYLVDYAEAQLRIVLSPRLLQLRRLVIGEVARFPDLARALHDRGPQRALANLTSIFTGLAEQGVLTIDDPAVAASHFNWLIMGEPINAAMLLGDTAVPAPGDLHQHVVSAIRVFLAAYAPDPVVNRSLGPLSATRRPKGAFRPAGPGCNVPAT